MAVIQEQFENAWSTTLAQALTLAGTTIYLTSVAGLPATGQIRFKLGSGSSAEKVICPLNGTATLAGCTRAAEGSTATTHTAGEAVTAVLTAGGLENYADWIRASMLVHDGDVMVHGGEVVHL